MSIDCETFKKEFNADDIDFNSEDFDDSFINPNGPIKDDRQALVIVRDLLREGKLDGHFDMSDWQAHYPHCGSVGCIGGWCNALGAKVESYSDAPEGSKERGLSELFYPEDVGVWDKITPEQAAQAIDNYLETGSPNWTSIIPNPQYNDR